MVDITDRLNGPVPSILAMRDGALEIFQLRREVKSVREVSIAKDAEIEKLRGLLNEALSLKGGWREAIVELEDHCSEPVRLKNMMAAADQLDDWAAKARAAIGSAS